MPGAIFLGERNCGENDMDSQTPDLKGKILIASPVEACRLMGSNMKGLSQAEADRRLEKYGKNELPQKKAGQYAEKVIGKLYKPDGVAFVGRRHYGNTFRRIRAGYRYFLRQPD